jgi:hypothetical protein
MVTELWHLPRVMDATYLFIMQNLAAEHDRSKEKPANTMLKDKTNEKFTSPRPSFQEGNYTRAPIMMSPTVCRSRGFHPQRRVSIHQFQQGHNACAHRIILIRDFVFPQECTYSMMKPLVP